MRGARYVRLIPWTLHPHTVLTVMKRGDEVLNTSLPQFFRSDKWFITTVFTQHFNASSLVFFYRDTLLNASTLLLFKVTLPTSVCPVLDSLF